MTLGAETVRREFPRLIRPEDGRLFAAEASRSFPQVSVQRVSGEFFPAGWEGDLPGWKGLVKASLVRLTTHRVPFVPTAGRRPLVATDRFSNGYFHWVTETLPRLWWLRSELAGYELVLPAFASRFGYMTESLALFPGLTTRTLDPKTRWALGEATLVPATAPTGNYRPALVGGLGTAWRAKVGPRAPFRKLYVSRSKAARRRIANEDEVRTFLESQGFETVHLEGLAFADQVRLLAETEHLVSNHGAGLTNMLFMVPGSRVTEIRLEDDAHNNCFFSLARALDLDYRYHLAPAAVPGTPAHDADLRVDPQGLL